MGKFLVPHMLWFCSFWTCLFFKQCESMLINTHFLLILGSQTSAFSSKSRRSSCLASQKGFGPRARKQAKCLWIHALHYLFVLIPGHETKGISSRFCETFCPALRICFHPRASNDGDLFKILRGHAKHYTKVFILEHENKAKCLWIHALHYLFVLILGHEMKAFSSTLCKFSCLALRNCFGSRA